MLQGLKQECERIYWKRGCSWAHNQDYRDREEVKEEPKLRFSFYTRNDDQLAERKDVVDLIVRAVQNGQRTLGQAQRMLDALTEQWRQAAQARDTTKGKSVEELKAQLEAARLENARLRGE